MVVSGVSKGMQLSVAGYEQSRSVPNVEFCFGRWYDN